MVLNTEHCQPFIPTESPRQTNDRLLGKIRPKPFDDPDDITDKAIAQHQHPRRCVADFAHLLAEIECPCNPDSHLDLSYRNLSGQPQGIGRRSAMTDYGVPTDPRKRLNYLVDWRRNRAESAGRHSNVHGKRPTGLSPTSLAVNLWIILPSGQSCAYTQLPVGHPGMLGPR